MALIPVVDEQDTIIAYKERSEIRTEDIYRVASLWIKNSKGEILLARRSWKKKNDPGVWNASVAGTLEKGESYHENIIKEAEEELGLTNLNIKEERKVKYDGEHKFFAQRYTTIVDKEIEEFTIQQDEVAEIRWFTREQYEKEAKEKPAEFSKSIKGWFSTDF